MRTALVALLAVLLVGCGSDGMQSLGETREALATMQPSSEPSVKSSRTLVPTVPPSDIPTSPTGADTYVAVAKDTLWDIAQRHDRTVEELLAANPQITDRALIRAGDTIAIPSDDLHGLWNATLDLPARPADQEGCAQGPRTKLVDGGAGAVDPWLYRRTTQVTRTIEADLDHDGAPEAVAFIDCLPHGWGAFVRQVVAFDRRADGMFATMGVVMQEAGNPDGDANAIADISRMEAAPLGGIRLEVGDQGTLRMDTGTSPGLYQWRIYGWTGTLFVQTAGSTSFVVPPGTYDLSVRESPMTYAPVNSSRAGTMTVTIRNDGANSVEDLSVLLAMSYMPADCAEPGASLGPTCVVGRLDAGATRTVTLHHSITESELGADCRNVRADLQVRIGDQKYSETQGVSIVCE